MKFQFERNGGLSPVAFLEGVGLSFFESDRDDAERSGKLIWFVERELI